jgi:mono/diheme cytochrome c family protein/rhodanese-related sulfurtransferase
VIFPGRTLIVATLLVAGCGKPTPAKAKPTAAPVAASAPVPAAPARGRALYAQFCATCHGPTGNGYASDNAPSLKTTTFLASATDAFLRDSIVRGRPGTAMPAYGQALGGPLSPVDVQALVTFLRAGSPPPVSLPAGAVAGDAEQGKTLYQSTCARCHGTEKQRSTAVHLLNPTFLQTATDQFLRYAITEGRWPTSMVAWKTALASKQIDDLVAYLRSKTVALAAPAAPPPPPPRPPRTGPIVLNPRGRAPQFTLKDGLYVSIDQVKAALDAKRRLIITDARPPSDWMSLHITGAISTPYYDLHTLDDLPKDGTWIIAYCACPHHVSGIVVDELRKRGYPHTAVLDEGVYAWQQKKYPVVAAPGMQAPAAPPPPPSGR